MSHRLFSSILLACALLAAPAAAQSGAAPEPGAPVTDGALAVGALGGAAGDRALALVRVDRVAAALAAGRPLTTAGVVLTLDDPPAAS